MGGTIEHNDGGEGIEPRDLRAEDLDSARIVKRVQAGETDAYGTLYTRYFDRVYKYLLVVLSNPDEAEEGTQDVLVSALAALPDYELRESRPFRAWLFRIARNYAIDQLRLKERVKPVAPEELARQIEESEPPVYVELPALDWVTDSDLGMFLERLPLPQRQVLMLSFTADFSDKQIGDILGRNPEDVRKLQSRALIFLRDRLIAIGRGPERGGRIRTQRAPREAPVLRARRWSLDG